MKNLLALLLGLLLTLALLFLSFDFPLPEPQPNAAPSQPTNASPTRDPEQPTAEITEPVVYDLPMTAIVLTEQAEQSRDESGNVYFSYLYPNVRLYLQDESVSNAVTLDLLNRIDATRTQANANREELSGSEGATGLYQVQYVPQRIDGAVLSLSCTSTAFSGGAHPASACSGITYDLLTGQILTLEELLTEQCTADVLCRLVVDALSEINSDGLLYPDFSLSVEDRFSGNHLADTGWYLSREGLCFSFEPYEVGPYASGIITAVISYSKLPGYLEDAWFPMEQVTVPGSLTIEAMSDTSVDPYSDYVEINLDPSADALVIHTDTLVYDIVIQTIGPDSKILFAADQMTPGTSILLRSSMRNLQIRYHANGEDRSQPIPLP